MKQLYILGHPVAHSLSPAMHTAAYQHLNIQDQFSFTALDTAPEDLPEVMEKLKDASVQGAAITIPHKIEVIQYLDSIDETAQIIGAVNTIINQGGLLHGTNTDWIGTLTPLQQHTDLKQKHVALIGAGGASHAMAYAVLSAGANLTIYNRTPEAAHDLALKLQPHFGYQTILAMGMDNLSLIPNADIIINATPIGMGQLQNQTPIPLEHLNTHHIVFDAVYNPRNTRLLIEASSVGATTIPGLEMLLHQGVVQFKLFTGQEAPVQVMKQTLEHALQ